MSKLAKTVAWLALTHGLLTLGILVIAFSRGQSSATTLIIWSVVGVVGVFAGVCSLKGWPWAFWVLFALYLIQIADYWKPGFFFLSFMGPISINFGWNGSSPPSHFDVNLLAVAACIFTCVCARGRPLIPVDARALTRFRFAKLK